MATLTQRKTKDQDSRKVQLFISEDAYLRLKLAAMRSKTSPSQLVTDLIVQALPAVGDAQEGKAA